MDSEACLQADTIRRVGFCASCAVLQWGKGSGVLIRTKCFTEDDVVIGNPLDRYDFLPVD